MGGDTGDDELDEVTVKVVNQEETNNIYTHTSKWCITYAPYTEK